MNLTDLQVELRKMEEHLAALHLEIEKMKPKKEKKKTMDFETITNTAKQYPLNHLKIAKESEGLKKKFIYSLSYLLLTKENSDVAGRLLYLCRLAFGCKMNVTAEDIYRSGLEFEAGNLEKISKELIVYKHSYLIEAFIIANLSEVSVERLIIIADMAKLMDCDKEEICVIAQVAKSRVLDNPDVMQDMPCLEKNRWSGKFEEYIPEMWLVSQRKECITICLDKYENKKSTNIRYSPMLLNRDDYELNHPCVIKNRLQMASIVKKGDIILEYEQGVEKQKSIKAPMDGILYFLGMQKNSSVLGRTDKYMTAYVVSCFDDYDALCKWHSLRTYIMK